MFSVARSLSLALALLLSAHPALAQEKVRVGLVTTLTGPGALIGQELKNGWDLGFDALDKRIGGLETELFVVDDQLKPDVAIAGIEALIARQRVHVVAGVVWSNIMLAIADRVLSANTILLATNAGPAVLAGSTCNPLFISTSWQNEQIADATASLVQADGVSSVLLMAPNFQGGKDTVNSFRSAFKGKILDTIMFKLGEADFQADLSLIRSRQPESVVVFAPGAMGIAFLKQWQTLELSKTIKLYTINMVDSLSLPAVGEAVVGTFHTNMWNPTGGNPANVRFVKAYQARFGKVPTPFAAQAYDAVFLLDSGVRATGGALADKAAIVRAMRKAEFGSVRGTLRYNDNNFPIQDFYKLEVARDASGKPVIRGVGVVAKDHRDSNFQDCKLSW